VAGFLGDMNGCVRSQSGAQKAGASQRGASLRMMCKSRLSKSVPNPFAGRGIFLEQEAGMSRFDTRVRAVVRVKLVAFLIPSPSTHPAASEAHSAAPAGVINRAASLPQDLVLRRRVTVTKASVVMSRKARDRKSGEWSRKMRDSKKVPRISSPTTQGEAGVLFDQRLIGHLHLDRALGVVWMMARI
jgi:hypothetical protein